MIRVVICDDHILFRQGLRLLLERTSDIEVVGEADDGQAAIDLCEQLAPDVLVIDLAMPRMSGVQAVQHVCGHGHHSHTRAVMISMYSEAHLVQQALRAGASAYVLKSTDISELIQAIRIVFQGNTYLSPEASRVLVDIVVSGRLDCDGQEAFSQLTLRECEVLKLIAEGHTNPEMADLMHVSVKTVQKHRANLMGKLNIHDVAGLTFAAIRHGLVTMDD
ncbi:MAG: response regulator transcription factor [Anaerolineae bacterium]|nr:response regulator transcription factor [Anaerolineae bacterium]